MKKVNVVQKNLDNQCLDYKFLFSLTFLSKVYAEKIFVFIIIEIVYIESVLFMQIGKSLSN